MSDPNLSAFIWSVADLLRGDYKQSDYGKVILPFTVLRRLDCVLEMTKPKVLAEFAAKRKEKLNPGITTGALLFSTGSQPVPTGKDGEAALAFLLNGARD